MNIYVGNSTLIMPQGGITSSMGQAWCCWQSDLVEKKTHHLLYVSSFLCPLQVSNLPKHTYDR